MFRIFGIALLMLASAAAQAPEHVIRIDVNLVQVDAVVTDSRGKPVTDLTPADFEILQDGKPQTIRNFSYVKVGEGASSRPLADARGSVPAARIKRSDVRRMMALVVDDLGLSFESSARVRQALKKFVDEQMQPGDLVAIIRTGAGIGALQQFTSDKRILYAAIERVRFNGLGRVGIASFRPMDRNPDLSDSQRAERNEIFSVGTLGAIRYVVDGLRDMPGRKAVVLFSEDLRLFHTDSMRVLDSVRQLTDAANRSSVVIYTIDPKGLATHGLTASDDTAEATPEQIRSKPAERAQQEFDSREGLVTLANDTGGRFFANSNDLQRAVGAVLQDTEGYYLIGYQPAAETFGGKAERPAFHRIAVRVKRPGLQARSRTGFFGRPDHGFDATPKTREGQIAKALASPFGADGIEVRLTPIFAHGEKGSYLNTLLYIGGRDITFTDEPDGWHKAVIDVVTATFGDNGQAVDSLDKTYTLRLRDDAYKEVPNGIIYTVRHPLKKAGAYQMRVVVRDARSEKVGAASQFIEAPDVAKGRLTLSSVILHEPVAAAPDGADGQAPYRDVQASPAMRVFRQGQPVEYRFVVLNAKLEGSKPRLESQIRLFRDGKPVYEGKPGELTFENQTDMKHLLGGGTLKMGTRMAPGEYLLQVTVTDELAKESRRTATQWVDFEIREDRGQ